MKAKVNKGHTLILTRSRGGWWPTDMTPSSYPWPWTELTTSRERTPVEATVSGSLEKPKELKILGAREEHRNYFQTATTDTLLVVKYQFTWGHCELISVMFLSMKYLRFVCYFYYIWHGICSDWMTDQKSSGKRVSKPWIKGRRHNSSAGRVVTIQCKLNWTKGIRLSQCEIEDWWLKTNHSK